VNGIEINGVTLFLGSLPGRKQACFYFAEGSVIYGLGFVSAKNVPQAERLWEKMLEGIPGHTKQIAGLPKEAK
jgi:hypothetical protein